MPTGCLFSQILFSNRGWALLSATYSRKEGCVKDKEAQRFCGDPYLYWGRRVKGGVRTVTAELRVRARSGHFASSVGAAGFSA